MPEPYRSIELLPFDGHGWFARSNQVGLDHFIAQLQPKVVVELGSWLGASTCFIAERLHEDAVLYAIDNWNQVGSEGVQKNPEWAAKLPTLYQSFLSNVIHKELTHIIVPIRMDTREAAKALAIMPDLIYVDASHKEDDVYQDVRAWYPRLNKGGIMCGDDWSWQSVQKGVLRAAQEINQVVSNDGTFWWFEKKK